MYYLPSERYDILNVYLKNNKNGVAARREYSRLYPERRIPSRGTFSYTNKKAQNGWSLKNKKRLVPNNDDRELEILLYYQENPKHSIRDGVRDLNYSYGLIAKILKRNHMKPYKLLPVQQLTLIQAENRLNFCTEMLNRLNDDPNFFNNIVWTDEATFTTSGMFNRRNHHYYAFENPRIKEPIKRQGRTSVHVWCGIVNNQIIGPVFFNYTLTGERYVNLLHNEVEHYLEELPVRQYNDIIWQQDGAPPHNTQHTRNFLNNRYVFWIGKHGTLNWPANSPDLTVMDTFLWGYLKNLVYKERSQNILEIQEKIVTVINSLNENNQILINAINNSIKRYRLCIQNNGGHVEHLL